MTQMNRLYVLYGKRRWDRVASGGTLEELVAFASRFPGRRWEARTEDDEVLKSGTAARWPEVTVQEVE